ncbi:MAG: dihydrodipicolinate synthase family protein [Oscillospiraceae bacterium]|nr:dihydrodipicolinate synthase family protein [Oscillospiraceae bacterium]
MELKKGFYTALGTPIDENGDLIADSLVKQIEMQIAHGASGLLLMGSMGIEVFLKNSTWAEAVQVAVKANAGRLPLFVGAMDCSVAKVMEKVNLLNGAKIDGIVLTTPFYSGMKPEQVVNFYTRIADKCPVPVFLYDLAVATKIKITRPMVDKLVHHPNIAGIKTADWELIHYIARTYPEAGFQCLYSGLDSFDYANKMGIEKNLDGMFACTPKNGRKLYDAINAGDYTAARKYLDNILKMRDAMASTRSLMVTFGYAMGLLGCPGNYHQDYCLPINEAERKLAEETMREIGEI